MKIKSCKHCYIYTLKGWTRLLNNEFFWVEKFWLVHLLPELDISGYLHVDCAHCINNNTITFRVLYLNPRQRNENFLISSLFVIWRFPPCRTFVPERVSLSVCSLRRHRAADVNTNWWPELKYRPIISDRLHLCLSCVFPSGLVGSASCMAAGVKVDTQVMKHYQMRSAVTEGKARPSHSSRIIRQSGGQTENWLQSLKLDICYHVKPLNCVNQLSTSTANTLHDEKSSKII